MHTFEEICTRSPANPKEAPLDDTMPQAAWEALLWDTVQGPRPPNTPETLRRWLQTTDPQAWAIDAPQASPPGHHHHIGKGRGMGKGRDGDRKGHSGKGARKGPK